MTTTTMKGTNTMGMMRKETMTNKKKTRKKKATITRKGQL